MTTLTVVSQRKSLKSISAKLPKLENLTLNRELKVRGFDECYSDRFQRPFGARVSRFSKLLNALAAVATVDSSRPAIFLQKAFVPTMLSLTVENSSTDLSGGRAGRS